MEHSPVSRIALGTMTFGYDGRGVRITDREEVRGLLGELAAHGHDELDTCYVYGDGTTEQMLGDLSAARRFRLAVRFDPLVTPHGHEPDALAVSMRASLNRLQTDKAQILYLNVRDPRTPIEATLRGVQALHDEGLFDELGLSNMSADDVAEYTEVARQHSLIRPTVYQGLYNAISRTAEADLLPVLREQGIRFHAYNPLAGGAFASGFGQENQVQDGSRFDKQHRQGREYRDRYWNETYLSALADVAEACRAHGVAPTDAALRWLVHHSALDGELGDGIILGASSLRHLRHNLAAVADGPIAASVLAAIEDAAQITRPAWPPVSVTLPQPTLTQPSTQGTQR